MESRSRKFRAHFRNASSLAGVAGPIILIVATLIAQGFHKNYDWIRQSISQLGTEPYGWIENTGFILLGLLLAIFADALYAGFTMRKSLRAAIIVWILIGVGFIIAGVFHADAEPDISTTLHGDIHLISAYFIAALFPIACFLLIPSFENDPHWSNMVVYTIISGIGALLLDTFRVAFPNHLFENWNGIYERIVILNAIIWVEIIAVKLLPHRRDLG